METHLDLKSESKAVTPISILKEKITVLKKRLSEKASEAEILALISECQNLVDPLDNYLTVNSSKPSAELDNLEKKTNNLNWKNAFEDSETHLKLEKEMLSGKLEGQFLKLLVAATKAKTILEIGSFTGYASLAMAEALPDDGTLLACEYDQYTAKFAQKLLSKSPHGYKIKIVVGDASNTLEHLKDNPTEFDFVFIDADKTGYLDYYKSIMDNHLLRKNGLICVDNTLFMGEVYSEGPLSKNGEAIKEFNEYVSQDERVQKVLVPLRDGVTLIRRIV